MHYMLVRHQVADFDSWKKVYDAHASAREGAGIRELHLWRNVDNSSEVVIVFEAGDVGRAKKFAASEDLKDAMSRAGVRGQPDIVFLESA